MRITKLLAASSAALLIAACGQEEAPPEISFADDVQPILAENCVSCHSGEAEGESTSGLNLATYEGVRAGTSFGPVVVAGSAESSTLYLVVAHKTGPEIHMPPHHRDAMAEGRGTSLNNTQIRTIRLWIDQGAHDN